MTSEHPAAAPGSGETVPVPAPDPSAGTGELPTGASTGSPARPRNEASDPSYWRGSPPPATAWETGLPAGPPGLPRPPQWWGPVLTRWWPEIAVGLAIPVLFLWTGSAATGLAPGVLAAGTAMTFRRLPGLGLALLWAAAGLTFVTGTIGSAMAFVLAVPVIAFGCARYGSRATLVLSLLSLVVTPIIGALLIARPSLQNVIDIWRTQGPAAVPWGAGISRILPIVLAWLALLVVPWGVGRFMRSLETARLREAEAQQRRAHAERERGYAQQVADLKAGQAQLARDVHDVVGHSLAVILAQAESAQYLHDDETDKMRETLANVATSARRSLRDVRAVLTPSPNAGQPPATGLDALIDGVATAGNDVRRTVTGTPRPLPPDLEQIAYRVLQEMLTNALKHGRRGGPVWVEQEWPVEWRAAYLRIEVRNLIDQTSPEATATGSRRGGGLGLDGMRYRLESAGGQLRVEESTEAGGRVFTAVAWLPLRAAEVDVEGTR